MVSYPLCSQYNRHILRRNSAALNVGQSTLHATSHQLLEERGAIFETGPAFYRANSAQARDLAVLAAAVHCGSVGRLRVLDALCGSGVRGVRYLQQAGADMVWCNDGNAALGEVISGNLRRALLQIGHAAEQIGEKMLALPFFERQAAELYLSDSSDSQLAARVTHADAKKLLLSCALLGDYYDLIDLDSFGSDATCLGPALDAVCRPGLLYLTSTDGLASSGRAPGNALASYGAYTHPVPYANEVGLRILVGAAAREAAARGLAVTPLFSLYSPHGPVFRSMLRVEARHRPPAPPSPATAHPTPSAHGAVSKPLNGTPPATVEPGTTSHNGIAGAASAAPQLAANYAFIAHCRASGDSRQVDWADLGSLHPSPASAGDEPGRWAVVGPLWTGPLHCGEAVAQMAAAAEERGWAGHAVAAELLASKKLNQALPLEQLLAVLAEEADLRLPPWHFGLDEVARQGQLSRSPPRDALIAELRNRGFVAARCHIDRKALKSNASMAGLIEAAAAVISVKKDGA